MSTPDVPNSGVTEAEGSAVSQTGDGAPVESETDPDPSREATPGPVSPAGDLAPATESPTSGVSSDDASGSNGSGPASGFSLQGTSVIDGLPVAVINEVRVFVGDWIGGARVVEITDREVRLDLDGTLVTLTL